MTANGFRQRKSAFCKWNWWISNRAENYVDLHNFPFVWISLLCLVGLVLVSLWFCAQCFFYPHRSVWVFTVQIHQCAQRAYSFLWKSSSINVCACALHTHTQTTYSITHSLTCCIHSRIFFEAAKKHNNTNDRIKFKRDTLWIKLEFHRSRLVSNWLGEIEIQHFISINTFQRRFCALPTHSFMKILTIAHFNNIS